MEIKPKSQTTKRQPHCHSPFTQNPIKYAWIRVSCILVLRSGVPSRSCSGELDIKLLNTYRRAQHRYTHKRWTTCTSHRFFLCRCISIRALYWGEIKLKTSKCEHKSETLIYCILCACASCCVNNMIVCAHHSESVLFKYSQFYFIGSTMKWDNTRTLTHNKNKTRSTHQNGVRYERACNRIRCGGGRRGRLLRRLLSGNGSFWFVKSSQ